MAIIMLKIKYWWSTDGDKNDDDDVDSSIDGNVKDGKDNDNDKGDNNSGGRDNDDNNNEEDVKSNFFTI